MKTLLTGETPDALTGKTWRGYLDDTTFADFWLVNTIAGSNELDFPQSCYKERGGRLKAGPFWNFDYEIFRPDYTLVRKDLLYYPNLFKNSEFTALVKERWAELQPKFLALKSFIGEQMELLSEAGALNDALWPEISVDPNSEAELSANEAQGNVFGAAGSFGRRNFGMAKGKKLRLSRLGNRNAPRILLVFDSGRARNARVSIAFGNSSLCRNRNSTISDLGTPSFRKLGFAVSRLRFLFFPRIAVSTP